MNQHSIPHMRLQMNGLELKVPGSEGIKELADLAANGVHPAGYMPFSTPWTEGTPTQRAAALSRWIVASQVAVREESWNLIFGVRHNARWIGSTNLIAKNFIAERCVSTGSWLGLPHQGRGFGKQMRLAVLSLAFDHLGALLATSEAFEDNLASRGVNEGLGYQITSDRTVLRRGEKARLLRYELSRIQWDAHSVPRLDVEGVESFLQLIGMKPT